MDSAAVSPPKKTAAEVATEPVTEAEYVVVGANSDTATEPSADESHVAFDSALRAFHKAGKTTTKKTRRPQAAFEKAHSAVSSDQAEERSVLGAQQTLSTFTVQDERPDLDSSDALALSASICKRTMSIVSVLKCMKEMENTIGHALEDLNEASIAKDTLDSVMEC